MGDTGRSRSKASNGGPQKKQCEGKDAEDLVFTSPSGGHLREQSAKTTVGTQEHCAIPAFPC